jgi:heat shock protein HtpX
MWELIQANKRDSVMLMILMAVVLLALGLIIGLAVVGPQGGLIGVGIAAVVWLILTLISFSSGDQILLAASRAQPVTHDVHPQLFNVVEEMKIAAGLPAMPKIYIINDPAPNAFATGRSPQSASIAVTAGLLGRLNRDELQGVVAHEMSHILHRDILYVTMAGVMLGGVVLISQVFLRGMFRGSLGSNRRYSSDSRGGGQAQLVIALVAVLAAILAPLMAQLLYFALSRRREYLADAGAARLTRYPEGLASALEKIANDPAPQLATANEATAPLYIVNPFKKRGKMDLSAWTSTHPPLAERVRILRNMSQGASYKDYAQAFATVSHSKNPVPVAAITKEQVPIRQGQGEATKQEKTQKQIRQIGDIMRKVNGFLFLTCACGLKIKVPPDFKANAVGCPRCGRALPLQATEPNQAKGGAGAQ